MLVRVRLCLDIDWYSDGVDRLGNNAHRVFFCFLRRNNFIVRKADAFNTHRHLCRGDMNFWPVGCSFHIQPFQGQPIPRARTQDCADPWSPSGPRARRGYCIRGRPHTNPTGLAFAVPARDGGGITPLAHTLVVRQHPVIPSSQDLRGSVEVLGTQLPAW